MNKSAAFFNGLVIVAVVLVIVHTAAEELGVILRLAWDQRVMLLYAGLALDIVFTLDFLVRSYFALLHRRMGHYFFGERGWMDFLASVPLLVLVSGPSMLAVAAGSATLAGFSGVSNLIEITKAVRSARALRLLRLVKFFPVRRQEDSESVARASAASLAIGSLLIVGFVAGLAPIWLETGSLEERTEMRFNSVTQHIDHGNLVQPAGQPLLSSIVALEPDLLVVHHSGRRIYSRYDDAYYRNYLGPHDYLFIESGDVGVSFDVRPIHAAAARTNLTYLAMALVIALLTGLRSRRRSASNR